MERKFSIVVMVLIAVASLGYLLIKPRLTLKLFEMDVTKGRISEYCVLASNDGKITKNAIFFDDGRMIPATDISLPSSSEGGYITFLFKAGKLYDAIELPKDYSENLLMKNKTSCRKLKVN